MSSALLGGQQAKGRTDRGSLDHRSDSITCGEEIRPGPKLKLVVYDSVTLTKMATCTPHAPELAFTPFRDAPFPWGISWIYDAAADPDEWPNVPCAARWQVERVTPVVHQN